MQRRLLPFILGPCLVITGCGTVPGGLAAPREPTPRDSVVTLPRAEAEEAFVLIRDLDLAWQDRDCTTIEDLTTGAEETASSGLCEAIRNGYPAPDRQLPSAPEYLLPVLSGKDRWFVALTREPEMAYYVFVHEAQEWRLAAGPIPLVADHPVVTTGTIGEAAAVQARLVPQTHLTYLTDPAKVSGIEFPRRDVIRELRDDLVAWPERVRPDRLTTHADLPVRPRTLPLLDGGALVFHVVRLTVEQLPAPGRRFLVKPAYRRADLRGFAGAARVANLTATELVLLATRVSPEGELSTVAFRRELVAIEGR